MSLKLWWRFFWSFLSRAKLDDAKKRADGDMWLTQEEADRLAEVIEEYARIHVGEHPEDQVLAAYCDESLPHERMEEVRDHLSKCPECSELCRSIHTFMDELGGPCPLPEFRGRAADAYEALKWEDFKERLRREMSDQLHKNS